MLLERLWPTALRSVQWEDTIRFHATLFRCFLLGLVDAHGELALLSQGSARFWAILGQRLGDLGLLHDAGRLHAPGSHPARESRLGHHDDPDATTRCPPKWRYEAPSSSSSFTASDPPMDQSMGTPWTVIVPGPPFVSRPINNTHGLHGEPTPSAVADDPSGLNAGRVLRGYDDLFVGVVGGILLWLLALAIVVSRCSSMARARSDSTRAMCRSPKVAVDSTTNAGKRASRLLLQDHLSINEATESGFAGTLEDVGHRTPMPGAWLHERQEQSMLGTLEESVLNTMPWMLFSVFSGLTPISVALDSLTCSSNDVATVGRKCEDGRSPACQRLGSDLDAGVAAHAVLNGTEQQGAAPDPLLSESGLSIRNDCGPTTTMHGPRCEPSAIGGVAVKNQVPAQATTLGVVCRDKPASSGVDRISGEKDITSGVNESASSDGTEDEALFGIGTQRADVLLLAKKDAYRGLGRRQDGALLDTGCTRSLRRAHSTGYLWKKRDMFDAGDEGTGDDSYWTEQVNARLSGERDSRHAPCRYGWSDVSSWPREGREDESDNWRTRDSQVAHFTVPDKTSDAAACRASSSKLRRYSSPPLNVDVSLSHRAGSGDGPQGIYVVPQKRAGGRYWSRASSPRPLDQPSGLGFFPFRKTPAMLTPEAWRPGCLHVADPPEDESRQADTWLESVTSVGTASAEGHTLDAGTEIQDVQGTVSSRDAQYTPVSWRDRYENDPASRRFISVHRRAMTQG